jgi:hypothetical protein
LKVKNAFAKTAYYFMACTVCSLVSYIMYLKYIFVIYKVTFLEFSGGCGNEVNIQEFICVGLIVLLTVYIYFPGKSEVEYSLTVSYTEMYG